MYNFKILVSRLAKSIWVWIARICHWRWWRQAGLSQSGESSKSEIAAPCSGAGRNVASHGVGTVAKEMLFHLPGQVLPGTRVGEV